MTRRFIFSLAIAAVTASTLLPVVAEAGRSQLIAGQSGGHGAPGGLSGGAGHSPLAGGPNSSPDNYPDKYFSECQDDYGGGMITDENGNYDCVDGAGNSLW